MGRELQLWAESYDRSFDELFDLQDEIAMKTAIELQVKLTTGEEARVLSRTTDNVRAWVLYQQALSSFFTFSREGNREARRLASWRSRRIRRSLTPSS